METQAQTFERASAMPAATWHFLKMNDVDMTIPAGLEIAPDVKVSGACELKPEGNAFGEALARAQEAWEQSHPEPTPEERAEREAFLAAEADATYGGTAQSDYQIGADAIEEARSLAVAFENGVGEEASAYLRYAAQGCVEITAAPGKQADAQVLVSAAPGVASVAAIDIVAGASSTVNLSIVVDGSGQQGSPSGSAGIAGSTVRVFADEGSRVNITRTQTLDDAFTDIDDMGLFAHDRAHIDIRQTLLGAGEAFAGMAGDLRGESSIVTVDTRYLGHGSQSRDLNYILRHHGPKTQCNLKANGVLAGKSNKTLRGTIDLIRGCKGAEGSENETVLLVDDGVKNKTVPVILCNEDDVAGNHGATIGHIREEQLFYLSSRGLSQEDAERMFVGAIVEQAAIDAPDEEARAGVIRLGDGIVAGFASLFDEEA